jgi:CrcB protein
MRSLLIVFLGSGFGGAARHFFNVWVTRLAGYDFPIGVLAINVLGSLAIGAVAGWFAFKSAAPQDLRLFLTTGVIGGFTTFSAFSLDAVLLYERGQYALAVAYILGSVALSIGALMAAMNLMRNL